MMLEFTKKFDDTYRSFPKEVFEYKKTQGLI